MTLSIPRTSFISGDHLQSTSQSSCASGNAERRAGTTGMVCTKSPRELSRTARSRFGRELDTLVLPLGLRRLGVAQQMLDGSGETMPEPHDRLIALIHHPVELHDAALAAKRQMSVPGMIRAQKSDEIPPSGDNFGRRVFDVFCAQQTQASPGVIPERIQINQDRDDFANRIGVNLAVAAGTAPAHRNRRGPTR